MNMVSLQKRIKDECERNELFRKGRRLSVALAMIYLALRLLDPLANRIFLGIPFSLSMLFSADMILPLILAVWAVLGAIGGSYKLSGWICILNTAATMYALLHSASINGMSLGALLRTSAIAWYMLFFTVCIFAIGVIFLANRDIRLYGIRMKELIASLRNQPQNSNPL